MVTRKARSYDVGQHQDEKDKDEDVDVRCGYGSCEPEAIQMCNSTKTLLIIMCIFTCSEGFVVYGINSVNTQSVERRFRLPSSRSSLISSSYGFAFAIFGVVISFLGSGRFKARWLSAAAVIMGLGSFTMALPHFTTGLYEWGQDIVDKTCFKGNVTEAVCEGDDLQQYLGVLMFGMILHGIGGGILATVGVGLIDDSVAANKSPLYIGIVYGFRALGVGLGYVAGGQLLYIYVDFDKVDTSTINLPTDDPRWVGAWWASYIVTLTTFLLVAIPLSCFGAELPTAKKIRETRVSQMHKADKDSSAGHGTSKRLPIKMFPKVTWALLRNAPFVCTMIAGACEASLIAGFLTFVPKYIQNHFAVSSGTAALYTGAVTVPGAACGMFFGGFICIKLKLKVRGIFKFCIITCFLAIVCTNLMWISCDEGNFAGVTTPYVEGGETGNVLAKCNANCSCSTRYYDPVCSDSGEQYFSACHAGCEESSADGKTFTNCSCVAPNNGTNISTVTSGLCHPACSLQYLFLVMFFILTFVTNLSVAPSDSATLRCVHEDHRTFSMGLKWMFIRLVGSASGPVIFGAVTDMACLIWQTECGENTSCWIYDNFAVSRNYFIVGISLKFVSILFFSLAFCLYKPPDDKETVYVNEREGDDFSFVNGSFKASEFEQSVLEATQDKQSATDKTADL